MFIVVLYRIMNVPQTFIDILSYELAMDSIVWAMTIIGSPPSFRFLTKSEVAYYMKGKITSITIVL